MPDELWMEVRDIVQETGIKTIPMEKKCTKAKWLSEEALQMAVKRREVKGKGEKERYKHLNAEFQRRARRDKKAFLRDQCKEIEENNRMGTTRDLFKKIGDTKGTFHAKKGKSFSRAQLFVTPWTVACTKLLRPWDFQGKSTGAGCQFLLQGIFPTQGSNPGIEPRSLTL